jgi:hypothetical protein
MPGDSRTTVLSSTRTGQLARVEVFSPCDPTAEGFLLVFHLPSTPMSLPAMPRFFQKIVLLVQRKGSLVLSQVKKKTPTNSTGGGHCDSCRSVTFQPGILRPPGPDPKRLSQSTPQTCKRGSLAQPACYKAKPSPRQRNATDTSSGSGVRSSPKPLA